MSSATFAVAAKAHGEASRKAGESEATVSETACQLVAIGFLSKMTKKEINLKGREASGVTQEDWDNGKGAFSKAWRSLDDSPGKYGFGETLATQWASGDFSVALGKAYDLSAPPKKETDKVAAIAKAFANLTAQEQQAVLAEVTAIAHVQAIAHTNIMALVAERTAELIAA